MSDAEALNYAVPTTPLPSAHRPKVFGSGGSNICTAGVVVEPQRVSILPLRTPVVSLVMMGVVFAGFTAGWVWLVYLKARDPNPIAVAAGAAIGVMTTIGTPLLIGWHYRYSRRKGGWLVIDFESNTVNLLRENRTFPYSELLRIEYVCMNVSKGGRTRVGEIRLIRKVETGEERICVLSSIEYTFRRVARELAGVARVPMLHVRQKYSTGEIEITLLTPKKSRLDRACEC